MINHTPYQYLIDAVIRNYEAAPGMPTVDFTTLAISFYMNGRIRTVGGICTIKPAMRVCTIQLNTELFRGLSDDERQNIIAHELAHALAFFFGYPREHHGPRWKRIARAMGDTGDRCHTLKVKHNMVRRIVYTHRERNRLYVLSPKKAKTLGFEVLTTLEYVGEVEIDRNALTYRWKSLMLHDLRDAKMFVDKIKLIA